MRANLQVKSSSGRYFGEWFHGQLPGCKSGSAYDLQVQAKQVQAGAIMKDTSLQSVTASLQVKGKGLTLETADAALERDRCFCSVPAVQLSKY